jgi:hypothetical protein
MRLKRVARNQPPDLKHDEIRRRIKRLKKAHNKPEVISLQRLTREEIFNESPGQRLDAWVAENVIAVPPLYVYTENNASNRPVYANGHKEGVAISDQAMAERTPNYSTDITAAWKVVETLNSRGWPFFIEVDRQGKITAGSVSTNPEFITSYHDTESFSSVSEAICKAALLLAVDAKEQ